MQKKKTEQTQRVLGVWIKQKPKTRTKNKAGMELEVNCRMKESEYLLSKNRNVLKDRKWNSLGTKEKGKVGKKKESWRRRGSWEMRRR